MKNNFYKIQNMKYNWSKFIITNNYNYSLMKAYRINYSKEVFMANDP